MLKDLIVYQHEFRTPLYLDPPTMDIEFKPKKRVQRLDFLFVKDAIKLGRIGPLEERKVEAIYAILTEMNYGTVVFRHPYEAHIRHADNLIRLKTKEEAANALIIPLSKLMSKNKDDNLYLNRFLDSYKKYI